MDGFNVIPVDKNNFKDIEILDPEKEKQKVEASKRWSLLFILSFICLFGVVGYFIFLVFYRVQILSQIVLYSNQMQDIGKNIDIKEMQEFQAMDISLKTINNKLSNHVLSSNIFSLINKNIRSSLQLSEYRYDLRDKTIEVNLSIVSPSFKELAEQTEKFFTMKEEGLVQSFGVSNLSFESETRKLKFSVKLILDKSKFNALILNTNI